MTHYQNLATIVIRVIGFFLMVLGITFSVMGFLAAFLIRGERQFMFLFIFSWSMPVIGIGFSSYMLSKRLAKVACSGLNKLDEQK